MSIDRIKFDNKNSKKVFVDKTPVKYILVGDEYVFADPIDVEFYPSPGVIIGTELKHIDGAWSSIMTPYPPVKTVVSAAYGSRLFNANALMSSGHPADKGPTSIILDNLDYIKDSYGGKYIQADSTFYNQRKFWASAQLSRTWFPGGTYIWNNKLSLPPSGTEYTIKADVQISFKAGGGSRGDTIRVNSNEVWIEKDGDYNGAIYNATLADPWKTWLSISITTEAETYTQGETDQKCPAANWFRNNLTASVTGTYICKTDSALVGMNNVNFVLWELQSAQEQLKSNNISFDSIKYDPSTGKLLYGDEVVKNSHTDPFVSDVYKTIGITNGRLPPSTFRWLLANYDKQAY